ncbi:S8 family serine peptidase [Fodinicola feengrottensis]|uniref:S8 family serine peptidase n=1 Tax=Fodinicola feengrottensis TaxID=435914 RepID=UPI0036F19CDC
MRVTRGGVGRLLLCLVLVSAVVGSVPFTASGATLRQGQWYLDVLHIQAAQQVANGQGVVVAVIDSGCDSSVPALSGRLLAGTEFGLSSSPMGTVDTSSVGHGTQMAGIIAGTGANEMTELGVAPGATILPIAVPESAISSDSNIAQGIRWGADHGAKIENISIGFPGYVPADLAEAVRYAQSRDVVVVAGVGNVKSTGPAVSGLAALPGVVAVSGVDEKANFWSGSAHGPEVVLSAPSVHIVAPVPTRVYANGIATSDGTSSATAIVSGVVALVRSKYPSLDAANVINRLIRTAVDQGPKGRDPYFGFGTVHPVEALTENVAPVSGNPLIGPGQDGQSPAAGGSQQASPGTGSGSGSRSGGGVPVWLWVVGGVCLLFVLVAVVVLVVVLVSSGRRRRRGLGSSGSYGPGGFPPPPVGSGPPPGGYPSGSGGPSSATTMWPPTGGSPPSAGGPTAGPPSS